MAHRGYRPGARPVAVHDGGVEHGKAVLVEDRAAAGVELWIVLHGAHRGDDRIQARATLLEHRVAGIERRRESGAVRGLALGRHLRAFDDAGTPVDDDRDRMTGGARRCREPTPPDAHSRPGTPKSFLRDIASSQRL